MLAKAEPYTERTTKGAKTYYRARFAGFDRDDALAADAGAQEAFYREARLASSLVHDNIVSIIGRGDPKSYSTRAGAMAYCVADEDKTAFRRFHEALYKNQPEETAATFPDNAKLLEYARQSGYGRNPASYDLDYRLAAFGLKSDHVPGWELLVASNRPDIVSAEDFIQPGQKLRIPDEANVAVIEVVPKGPASIAGLLVGEGAALAAAILEHLLERGEIGRAHV